MVMITHAMPEDSEFAQIKPRLPRIAINLILRAVAARYGLEAHELQAHGRSRRLAHPRQLAMFLARALTGMSFPEIGRRLGGQFGTFDHSTIIFGVREVEARMHAQPALAHLILDLSKEITALHAKQHSPNGKDADD